MQYVMISIYCYMAAIYVYPLALISIHPAPTKDRVRGCLRCCRGAMGALFEKLFFNLIDIAGLEIFLMNSVGHLMMLTTSYF